MTTKPAHSILAGCALFALAFACRLPIVDRPGAAVAAPTPSKKRAKVMTTQSSESRRELLRKLIVSGKTIEAEDLAKEIGELSTPVLLELENSPDAGVRELVLALASMVQGESLCPLFIRRLSDAEPSIREFAALQIPRCHYHSLAPDLVRAGNEHTEFRSPIALALGQAGTVAHMPILKKWRDEGKSAQLTHNIGLALAKLGDPDARGELVKRLSLGAADDRAQALRDCVYLGDRSLIAAFGPALLDRTDVTALSIPEHRPMLFARVADIAVLTMTQLGTQLSFPLDRLRRLTDAQLAEAVQYVAQLAKH
jgi:HEAT repeat protein